MSLLRSLIEWWNHVFDKPESYVALFTALLFISTFALWWSTSGMLRASNEVIRLTTQELVSSNRAHMRLKHIWFGSDDDIVFTNDIWNDPIEVTLDVVNVGNTPGLVTLLNYLTLIVPSGLRLPQRPPYNDPDLPDRPRTYQFRGSANPIQPGITVPFSVCDGRVLTSSEAADIQSGRARLYFIGTIAYWTAIGGVRQTAFCRYLRFDSYPPGPQDRGRFRKDDDPDYEFQD